MTSKLSFDEIKECECKEHAQDSRGQCGGLASPNVARKQARGATMTDKEIRSDEAAVVQKRSEETLRDSEERYRTMIGNLPGFVYRCENDRHWTMSFISDGCRDITGYAPEDFLHNKKLTFNDIIRQDYRERVWVNVQDCLQQKKAFQHEYPIVVASGETDHWVWERGRGIFSDAGQLLYIEGFITDITERKQAEKTLYNERLLLRTLIDNIPDSIYSKDLACRKTLANSTEVRYLGVKSEADVLGKDDFDIYPKELAEKFFADDQLVLQTGEPVLNREEYILDEKQQKRWLLSSKLPLRNQEGRIIGLVGIGRDITDRKQAQEETQRERAFFDQLVETAPEGIAIADPQGRVMRVNAEFVRMFGYGVDEVVGQYLDDLVAPPARQEEAKALTRSTIQGGKNLLETVRRRKDGTLVDVSLIGASILVAGKLEAVYAIYRDITERKQAEEALRQSEAQLRQSQKMEAIGTLAGGVAHDFNNLLTGILGNIALMRSSLPPADPLLENLDAAETAARQAADLTQGLLTFGRSAMVLPVSMKIADALDATLAILKQSLPATMQIVRDDEQTTWNVLLDQSQMTQILLNLAVNARDAMKGKGMLTIRARNEVVAEEYVLIHPFARAGEFVHLSIRDTGPGIPPAILEHLFEPFHTTKPPGSGTGLGLSIVYGAVKQASGWITAESTEGAGRTAPQKDPSEGPLGLGEHPRGDWENILGVIGQTCSGATFDIYLPRCLETPPQSPPPSSPSMNVPGGTVLVVEDEPAVRTVAQALLTRRGYMVLTAPDGASALNVLRDHPAGIGLVLLDMTMPGMSTDEIVQGVRALDPTLPILLNSGYTSNDAVRRMLEEGSVQGFLSKPYDLHQLVENVQKLIFRG